MATLSSSFPHLILHRFVRQRTTLPFATLISEHKKLLPVPLKTNPCFVPPPFSPRSLFHTTPRAAISQPLTDGVALLENAKIEWEKENSALPTAAEGLKNLKLGGIKTPLRSLSVKEKKELASYAHSLGKKLKSQQVGKSGVTDTVIMALSETLEANELLKLKIHGTCPGELEDVVKSLEEATGSVVVGQIGRTVILYRPSLTKLKAEEKRKQAQRIYLKKRTTLKQFSQSKRPGTLPERESRESGRGRRGRTRV